MQHIGRYLVDLEARYGSDGKDIPSCGEYDGVDEARAVTCPAPSLRENSEQDAAECRRDGGKLGALAEGHSDKERPAGQRQPEKKVNDKHETGTGSREYAEVPDNGYDNPRW